MNHLKKYVVELQQTLDHLPWGSIEVMIEQLHHARMKGKQIFIMGNGGSAATASHLACDLGKNTVIAGIPRFRVHALTDNMAFFSACGNDYGYESVFAEQLANFIEEDDIVIAISTSGNSPNVLKAVQLAQAQGSYTIGWCGYTGGKLADLVNLPLIISNHSVEQIEDVHMILAHLTTVAVRQTAAREYPLPRTAMRSELQALMVN